MARCAENLHFTLDYRDLAACTVFFESVVGDQKVKHDVYMHIQESCPVCKVIASTSSAMASENLCAGLDCANKIVVTHPFNPPYLVPFVEEQSVRQTGNGIFRIPFKARKYRPVYARKEQSIRLRKITDRKERES